MYHRSFFHIFITINTKQVLVIQRLMILCSNKYEKHDFLYSSDMMRRVHKTYWIRCDLFLTL